MVDTEHFLNSLATTTNSKRHLTKVRRKYSLGSFRSPISGEKGVSNYIQTQ